MHYEGCHDIAEILLKVVLNTNQSINQSLWREIKIKGHSIQVVCILQLHVMKKINEKIKKNYLVCLLVLVINVVLTAFICWLYCFLLNTHKQHT